MVGVLTASGLMRKYGESGWRSIRLYRISAAILGGILLGGVFALLYSDSSSSTLPRVHHSTADDDTEATASSCESQELVNVLENKLIAISDKNTKLKMQISELTVKLRLSEQWRDSVRKEALALTERKKPGPFGSVRESPTNPTVAPDESVNPRLARILKTVAKDGELIVALANSNVKEMLQVWFTNIKRVGITNYLVYALDEEIAIFCHSEGVPFYDAHAVERAADDTFARTAHAVSGLKFSALREFLQMGYAVLLSDVDIVYLQNPFDHLYRDSDVESMTDGHDNSTAYGYNDVFDYPDMGLFRYVDNVCGG